MQLDAPGRPGAAALGSGALVVQPDAVPSSTGPVDLRPAPRGRRVGARIVDIVVGGWTTAFVAIEIDGRILGGDVFAQRPLREITDLRLAVITALVVTVIEVGPTALWGRTPGKAMLGLRCVDVDTGRAPGVIRSVFRGLLLHAWVAVPLLGWVLPVLITVTTLLAPRRRGLHDKWSGTAVVDVAPEPGPDQVRGPV